MTNIVTEKCKRGSAFLSDAVPDDKHNQECFHQIYAQPFNTLIEINR